MFSLQSGGASCYHQKRGNGPLSPTLSPSEGERENAGKAVVVTRRARKAGLGISIIANARRNPLKDGVMPTVSEQLRQARETQKLTVHQVAEVTKIRTDHLRALEEGNFDVFSAPVYIRGFVRSYCNLLKLDVPAVMSALEAELGKTKKFAVPPPFADPPRGVLDFFMLQLSKIDWRKGLIGLGGLVALLIIFCVFLIWRHYRSADPLSNLKPGVYHSTQSVSGQTLPLPAPKR